ncbi:MAG TPA: hypothetical protein VMB02_07755 [Candidatus Aquilonibacter sp.]|nr:hypothetical protein [Candidatus Aquilonibacter sp.]
MRISFALAAVLSIAALVAPCAPAQEMRSFQCIATSVTPGTSHITIYVSQLIPMELSQHAALAGAWAAYVKATYHTATISSTVCQPFGPNSTIQEQALAAEENAWKRQGWDVEHITWRPGQSPGASSAASLYSAAPGPANAAAPAPAPAAAAPPPAPAGPETRASYCFSDDRKPTIYLSDPFDTAGLPSAGAWSTAFTKFLAQKYSYKGTVTCKNAATIVAVQSLILDQRNDAWQGKQIVETDWTYEPPAPPSSDAAAH